MRIQEAEIDNLMLSGSGSAMFSLVDFEELPSGNLRKVEEVLLQELGAEFGLVTASYAHFLPDLLIFGCTIKYFTTRLRFPTLQSHS